jgi:hypothetical protein
VSQNDDVKNVSIANVRTDLWTKFKQWVEQKHGKIQGTLGVEFNVMLEKFLANELPKELTPQQTIDPEKIVEQILKSDAFPKLKEEIIKEVKGLMLITVNDKAIVNIKDVLRLISDASDWEDLKGGAIELLTELK